MIRIDLGKNELQKTPKKKLFSQFRLPPKLRAQLQKVQFSVSFLVILVASLAISALFPIFANQYQITIVAQHEEDMKIRRDKLGKIVQQVSKYSPFQRELASYEEQKKVVTERLTVVRQLLEQRGTPVNVLDTIGQSLPTRTWLNAIDFTLTDVPALAIGGSSYSNEEISDLIDNLSKSIFLNGVNLEEVATKADAKVEIKTFQITARPKIKMDPLGGAPANPPPENRAIAAAPTTAENKAPAPDAEK